MTIYRSYFSKNNTLISGNKTNNGRNPVCEISYGTYDKELSRFIFDVNLYPLKDKISKNIINSSLIVSHTLCITNTIRYAEEYIGKKSYSNTINRASDFYLDLFEIDQEWDEGSSYDFIYGSTNPNIFKNQESNWVDRKLNYSWDFNGAYSGGTNIIINSQYFKTGSENINMDITDYINSKIGLTPTGFGFGLKFQDSFENTIKNNREAVAFHSKYTNTVYEPYVETVIDDNILDDRNYFYLDKDNNLYLYTNYNENLTGTSVNNVTIYDHNDNIYMVISGTSIINIGNGIFKININIPSDTYPDAIIFRDVWNVTMNNKIKEINNQFYLISEDNYYIDDSFNFSNYYFSFFGIKEKEKINSDSIRKIKVKVKELYPNQNNFIPLDIEYRIFYTVGAKYEIDVIPFTKVNRTNYGYDINLDTSWLIPQDYKIQLRLKNGFYYENKETLNFTIVSNELNSTANNYIEIPDYSLEGTATVYII